MLTHRPLSHVQRDSEIVRSRRYCDYYCYDYFRCRIFRSQLAQKDDDVHLLHTDALHQT